MLFGLFGKPTYEVHCQRCHSEVIINAREAEGGHYRCPLCGGEQRVPEEVISQ